MQRTGGRTRFDGAERRQGSPLPCGGRRAGDGEWCMILLALRWNHLLGVAVFVMGVVVWSGGCEGAPVGLTDEQDAGGVRAPDFAGAASWLNTAKPITIGDVKGQVVILDFWTYCCINCMHIFPDL